LRHYVGNPYSKMVVVLVVMMCCFGGGDTFFGGTCFVHIEDRCDLVVSTGRAAVRNRKQKSL
jgi:hypothetical protein